MLEIDSSSPNYVESSRLSKAIKDFNDRLPALKTYLSAETSFHEVDTTTAVYEKSFDQICEVVQPTVIHCRFGKHIAEKLVEDMGFINLEVNTLIRDENERKTPIGLEFLSMVSAGKVIPAEMIVRMLRKIIYAGQECRNKFILSSFPDIIEQSKEFEKNCAKISAIIYHSANTE